jgi:hypothetical protein
VSDIRIHGVDVRPPEPLPPDAPSTVEPRHTVAIDLQNTSTVTQHVWVSRRSMDFDPTNGTLRLDLSDAPPPGWTPPPGIVPVSSHPQVPRQRALAPGERLTIEVPVPVTIRKIKPSQGLALAFDEIPVADIQRVELSVAFNDVPFQPRPALGADAVRRELREWGQVVRTTAPIGSPQTPARPTRRPRRKD